jgi:hypothetical protein
MQSIKISTKTKNKIEQTQAELLINLNKKVTQAELLEKIVDSAISDPEFMRRLFSETPSNPRPSVKKIVQVKIVERKKPAMRLFADEWTD